MAKGQQRKESKGKPKKTVEKKRKENGKDCGY